MPAPIVVSDWRIATPLSTGNAQSRIDYRFTLRNHLRSGQTEGRVSVRVKAFAALVTDPLLRSAREMDAGTGAPCPAQEVEDLRSR